MRHLQGNTTTLEGLERVHIVAVLEEANWLVGSPRCAAARLGMMRTTLLSLMKRLCRSAAASRVAKNLRAILRECVG